MPVYSNNYKFYFSLRRIQPASGLHTTASCATCTSCSPPATTWLPSTATRLPRPSSFWSTACISTSNCSTYSAKLHCTYASKFLACIVCFTGVIYTWYSTWTKKHAFQPTNKKMLVMMSNSTLIARLFLWLSFGAMDFCMKIFSRKTVKINNTFA